MAEASSNETSNEQIWFKLTSQLLPSFTHSKSSLPHENYNSLEYSLSRISIQNHLQEHEEWIQSGQTSTASPSKTSSLKASSINTTQASLRHTPKTVRGRTASSNKVQESRRCRGRLSFRMFQFQEGNNGSTCGAVHAEDRKRFWSEGKRQKSIGQIKQHLVGLPSSRSSVHTARSSPQKPRHEAISLLGLKNSLQIKPILLKADENRQKTYLKRLIQARTRSNHISDSLGNGIPLRSLWRPLQRPC